MQNETKNYMKGKPKTEELSWLHQIFLCAYATVCLLILVMEILEFKRLEDTCNGNFGI